MRDLIGDYLLPVLVVIAVYIYIIGLETASEWKICVALRSRALAKACPAEVHQAENRSLKAMVACQENVVRFFAIPHI